MIPGLRGALAQALREGQIEVGPMLLPNVRRVVGPSEAEIRPSACLRLAAEAQRIEAHGASRKPEHIAGKVSENLCRDDRGLSFPELVPTTAGQEKRREIGLAPIPDRERSTRLDHPCQAAR